MSNYINLTEASELLNISKNNFFQADKYAKYISNPEGYDTLMFNVSRYQKNREMTNWLQAQGGLLTEYLHHICGYTYGYIAEAIGVSQQTLTKMSIETALLLFNLWTPEEVEQFEAYYEVTIVLTGWEVQPAIRGEQDV